MAEGLRQGRMQSIDCPRVFALQLLDLRLDLAVGVARFGGGAKRVAAVYSAPAALVVASGVRRPAPSSWALVL